MKANLPALFGSALLATGAISALAPASAQALATSTCNAVMQNRVVGELACQRAGTGVSQDNVGGTNPANYTVNTEQFFNFSDWLFGGKIGTDAGRGYTGTASGQSGSWDISNVAGRNTWIDMMLVFKSGSERLIGYRYNPTTTNGTWQSPFQIQNNNYRSISHISVYYRIAPTPPRVTVPEPTTLFSLGLVGASLLMTRKRKNAQQA